VKLPLSSPPRQSSLLIPFSSLQLSLSLRTLPAAVSIDLMPPPPNRCSWPLVGSTHRYTEAMMSSTGREDPRLVGVKDVAAGCIEGEPATSIRWRLGKSRRQCIRKRSLSLHIGSSQGAGWKAVVIAPWRVPLSALLLSLEGRWHTCGSWSARRSF
jgi:hypothetical protein